MAEAFIFDLDGVLVDSLEAWFKLFNRTLRYFGKEDIGKQRFIEKVWGGPIERDAEEFFEQPVEKIKSFYFSNFDIFKKNLRLFPETKEVLSLLKSKGLKLGLATNTPKKQALSLLEYLKLNAYFDAVAAGDEVNHGKPDPEMILLVCRKIKVKPKDSIYVGDSKADMLAGKAAGCMTIGFKREGDKMIGNLKELLDIV